MKPSPIIARLQAHHEVMLAYQRVFTIQQALDMAMIALNDTFGFGSDRLSRFRDAYNAAFNDYCCEAIENGEADPEMLYVRGALDRRLKQMLGEDKFVPFEERYKFEELEKQYTGRKRR